MQKNILRFASSFLLQKFLLFAVAFALLFSPVVAIAATSAASSSTTNQPTQNSTQNSTPAPGSIGTGQNTTATTVADTKNVTKRDESVSCESAAGPLGFVFCPMYTQMTKAINWIAGPDDSMLTNLLRVEPLQFSKDQGLLRAYQNILTFANSLFILVFLAIIFAGFIRDFSFLDNYNLKNNLPRFIAAVILAQFGYLICSIAIDLGNIVGTLIPKTISAGVLGANVPMPSLTDGITGLLAFGNSSSGEATSAVSVLILGGGSGVVFILAFLLALFALVALIIAFIYMIARILVLYILVLAAPIAFLAFVLPGTQPFFFRWGKNLMRLVIMFPLVVTLITVAQIVSFMLQHPGLDPNTFTDDRFKLLVGGLIPFIALLMIPKCLKMGGDLTELIGGAAAGYAAGKIGSKDTAKNLQGNARDKMAESSFGKETRFGRALAGGGATALVTPYSGKVTRKLGEGRSRAAAVYEKAGSVGTESELKAMLDSRNTVERQAAIKALAKRGSRETLQDAFDAKKIKPIDMAALKTTDFKEFGGMPDMRSYELGSDGGYSFDSNKFFSGLGASTVMDAGATTQKSWFMNSSRGADGKWSYSGVNTANIQKIDAVRLKNILSNQKVQGKLDQEVVSALASYASAAGAADPHAQAILSNMDNTGAWH